MKIEVFDQLLGILDAPSIFLPSQAPFELFETPVLEAERLLLKNSDWELPERLVFGKRMEALVGQWLRECSNYELHHSQIQIFKEKITLGELDFLLFDTIEKKAIHVELVSKFYIYDEEQEGGTLAPWIGPNRKDSLLKKIGKLKGHQLPIIKTEEGLKTLRDIEFDFDIIFQKVCFKAYLFTPYQREVSLEGVSEKAVVGFWISWSEFQKEKFNDAIFAMPEKQNWMVSPERNDHWMEHCEMCSEVEQKIENMRSPLCWMQNKDGSYDRFFVVWW